MYESGKKPDIELPARNDDDCVVRKALPKPNKSEVIAAHQSRMAKKNA